MQPLTISDDRLMFLEEGRPWVQRGCLDWPAFGILMNDGELAFRDIVVDRRSVGANTMTVGLMWSRHPGLHPNNPKFWDSLTPMAHIAHEEGMRIQPIVFASTADRINGQPVEWLGMGEPWPGFPEAAQRPHWDRVLTHLGAEPNVNTFIVANQPGHRDQPIPTVAQTGQFPKAFPQQLICRSNPFEDQNPPLPVADFSGVDTKRRMPFAVGEIAWSFWNYINGFVDQNKWRGTRSLTVLLEPPPVDESEQHDPGQYFGWCVPGWWRQIARQLCLEGCGGGNFYSKQNRFGRPLTGITRMCAVEFLGNIPNP